MNLYPIPQADGFEYRNNQRGARDDWHTGNISRGSSRSINPVEHSMQFVELNVGMNEAVERVYQRYAKKYLKVIRWLLKPYNTQRHVITITASMGSCCICINDKLLQNYLYMGGRGIFLLLAEIEQALDWDWAAYLDGARIN